MVVFDCLYTSCAVRRVDTRVPSTELLVQSVFVLLTGQVLVGSHESTCNAQTPVSLQMVHYKL